MKEHKLRRENKKYIGFDMDLDLYNKIMKLAKAETRTLSNYIRVKLVEIIRSA